MKRSQYRIGPGAASLMLVVVVVSMSVLGLLALINARGDFSLTQRSIEFAASEYAASARAQHRLAELDGVLAGCTVQAADDTQYIELIAGRLPGDMHLDGRIVRWQLGGEEGRKLCCAIEILPHGAQDRYAWIEHRFIAEQSKTFFE